MSGENTRSCGTPTVPNFIFDSPQYQTICNNIYVSRSTTDAYVQ